MLFARESLVARLLQEGGCSCWLASRQAKWISSAPFGAPITREPTYGSERTTNGGQEFGLSVSRWSRPAADWARPGLVRRQACPLAGPPLARTVRGVASEERASERERARKSEKERKLLSLERARRTCRWRPLCPFEFGLCHPIAATQTCRRSLTRTRKSRGQINDKHTLLSFARPPARSPARPSARSASDGHSLTRSHTSIANPACCHLSRLATCDFQVDSTRIQRDALDGRAAQLHQLLHIAHFSAHLDSRRASEHLLRRRSVAVLLAGVMSSRMTGMTSGVRRTGRARANGHLVPH